MKLLLIVAYLLFCSARVKPEIAEAWRPCCWCDWADRPVSKIWQNLGTKIRI